MLLWTFLYKSVSGQAEALLILIRCRRWWENGGVKEDAYISGLENWMDDDTIHWNGEDHMKSSFDAKDDLSSEQVPGRQEWMCLVGR